MKRILPLLLAIAMLFSLMAGCGSTESAAEASAPAEESTAAAETPR